VFATVGTHVRQGRAPRCARPRRLGGGRAPGQKTLYRVQPYDTLWSIAATHYADDARAAVWRIERANRLNASTIHPGEVLRLP
jgi:nucleoid-associated protein YgaU